MKKASIIAKLGAAAMAAVMACSSIAASAATVPNATIDTTRKTSLELYKYDFTTAHEDGVLNTDSYVSTGLPDDTVETALADYAIQGVVFTYAKVADVTTYSALEADGYKDMVLYAMPDNAKTAQFLAALGLSAADAYRTDGGNLYFTSDVLIDGLSGQLTTIESQTKNALEKFVKDNGGTDMPETDANGHSGKTGMEQGLYILVETYIITEIATDDGYTLLKDSITVVITSAESGVICDVCGKSGITATATVNGDAVGMIEDNGSVSAIVPMSVINTLGFDLPQTGENGTWLFAVGGVLIVSLSAAFIFFILAKKRKTDEQ